MSVFNGKTVEGGEALTIIGGEAYFHGAMTVKGSLRVDGVIEGDITDAVSVQVGKTGRVKGNIATDSLSVAGEVVGDVVASRSIELLAKGRLHGKVRTPRLRIEDGGIFDGNCVMTGEEGRARESSASHAAEARRPS